MTILTYIHLYNFIFQVRDEFEESVEMSTYLVAFVVCDFASLRDVTKHNVNVSVIASKDKINQGQFALDTATSLMDHYTEFFQVQYPLQKQGIQYIKEGEIKQKKRQILSSLY